MTLEEAIKTAIQYETKIRDVYRAAAQKVSEPAGKSFLETMAEDEQRHLDYLLDRLEHWKKTGKLTLPRLETVIPSDESIAKQMGKFKAEISKKARGDQKRILSRALKVEIETSDFYKNMVSEMTGKSQALFARFLVIENRHIAAVQMQLDYATKTGYWFDMKEFDME
ncbi:MAG TPA: ferritin family protein [Desulfatiglandales bacterium]